MTRYGHSLTARCRYGCQALSVSVQRCSDDFRCEQPPGRMPFARRSIFEYYGGHITPGEHGSIAQTNA